MFLFYSFSLFTVLSILIPVYNFEITKLVVDLRDLSIACDITFEIVCFDDGSKKLFKQKNRFVEGLEHIRYKELSENVGRSAIRNQLAQAARYEYLLFMDCDSKVVADDFIKKYVAALAPDTLVYGGRVYADHPPKEKALLFHWHYGRSREQVDFRIRQAKPYHAFQTNNFLIPRRIFLDILFDENLRQYGHEDTLFGFELKNRRIKMLHIDNPLEHLGLETSAVFLEKTSKGIQNLLKLNEAYPFIETKLLRAYRFCQKTGLKYPLAWLYQLNKQLVLRRLDAESPNLRWFDFYKLGEMFLAALGKR